MNETENIFDRTIKKLKQQYWISIAVLTVYFLLILFDLTHHFFEKVEISVVLERYVIVISIIAIPVALKLFADTIKRAPPTSNIDLVIKKYIKASNIRLYTINAVTLMNIILYSLSRNMNFFWITIVFFIVYIFCKPSYPELANLLKNEEN